MTKPHVRRDTPQGQGGDARSLLPHGNSRREHNVKDGDQGPLPQDYEKNERGTRKGGYVEQMLGFAALCGSFAQQAEMYKHYRLEHVYLGAGLSLMRAAEEMKGAVSLMDAIGADFFERLLPLLDRMQADADQFLVHGGIDLDPRTEV